MAITLDWCMPTKNSCSDLQSTMKAKAIECRCHVHGLPTSVVLCFDGILENDAILSSSGVAAQSEHVGHHQG